MDMDWKGLSLNPMNKNAVTILEMYPVLIDWKALSTNCNAMHLLESNPDKIDWEELQENPSHRAFQMVLERNSGMALIWSINSSMNYALMNLKQGHPKLVDLYEYLYRLARRVAKEMKRCPGARYAAILGAW
ncbi:hypothetical protein GUITHDRAFT_110027 [Guillardia theta CCMP2712]|uniref:Uncharacterized protein n=1 Tax=Guillardia theta (strain CCMP2712) TaxID=905079 RepID=L1J736_GUITC|nr:hypothetical protein GUITHDRAFT_110027 [Guillardia theta CCMP2712]EKX43914.1 hypothetical protein GUITHDRAFT_110027 [Guillardia theta CCMP2712]|eukprot:XP_005830894.1 hypothetical protein GUITHDRAFT_110027 [Guillardia theta CCMP2712]